MTNVIGSVENGSLLIQLLLSLFGAGGVIGSFVAMYKLRPDINSQAVVQAQGANDIMVETIKTLREQLRQEQASHLHTRKQLETEREANRHLREMFVGNELWHLGDHNREDD